MTGGLPIGRHDYTVKDGDSIRKRYRWMRLNEEGERVVIPLTGRVFAATAAPAAGDPIDFAVDDSELDLGWVTLSLTPEENRALGRWAAWDLQQTVDGDVTTVIEGTIRKRKDVTQ